VLGDWITSVTRGITAFYDIDTPVTLSRLERGHAEYITPSLIPRFNVYLSFTGGPTLQLIEDIYGSPRARALYCAADIQKHVPVETPEKWTLGYIGTYSDDRQPLLEQFMLEPARRLPAQRFVVVGAQYPRSVRWPANVEQIEHLPPDQHSEFYCSQRYTLNLTRPDMVTAGYSPSVRLFEAGACGVPVISDQWPGLDTFFTPGSEILLADGADSVVRILAEVPDMQRRKIAAAARNKVLKHHTAEHRAIEFERCVEEAMTQPVKKKQKIEAA
jgi:spore maturation protein CgeB